MLPRPRDLRVFLILLIAGGLLVFVGRVLAAGEQVALGWLIGGPGAALQLAMMWCLVYSAAPQATRVATALALCAAVSFSILACWTLRAREESRRQSILGKLRQVVVESAPLEEVFPSMRTSSSSYDADASATEPNWWSSRARP